MIFRHSIRSSKLRALGFLLCLTFSSLGAAVDKPVPPGLNLGEWELELAANLAVDGRAGRPSGLGSLQAAVAFTPLSFWATELGFNAAQDASGRSLVPESFSWENRFQITEPDAFWVDLGVSLAYERMLSPADSDELEAKILIEKLTGGWLHTLNLALAKPLFGSNPGGFQGGLVYGGRLRWLEALEPGVEWHSDFGELQALLPLAQQVHLAGPAVTGRIARHWNYTAAWLFGLCEAAPRGLLRANLEYEFSSAER